MIEVVVLVLWVDGEIVDLIVMFFVVGYYCVDELVCFVVDEKEVGVNLYFVSDVLVRVVLGFD